MRHELFNEFLAAVAELVDELSPMTPAMKISYVELHAPEIAEQYCREEQDVWAYVWANA